MADARYEPLQMIGQQNQAQADQTRLKGIIHDRPAFATVAVALDAGQKVLADGRAMMWMDGNLPIETNMGECKAAASRYCAGESCCQNTFTGPGNVTFAMKLPGDILPFALSDEQGWIVAAGSFICGTSNVRVSSRFAGCMACLCGGTGPFLTRINLTQKEGKPKETAGMFYAGGYGALTRHEVPAGKTLYIDTGLFFAANEHTKIEIGYPGTLWNCWCGGEGLVMKFTGPCVVYSQNRDPSIWKAVLAYRPPPKSKGAVGGVSVSA